MALLEERRRKLAAEGLFDEARKQLIPFLPAMIGVVTSPTGAVIRDILHRISRPLPARVLVWPVRVQGETLRRRSRRRDRRLQRDARGGRARMFSSSRAAAARSKTSGASTRRSSCARRQRASSR